MQRAGSNAIGRRVLRWTLRVLLFAGALLLAGTAILALAVWSREPVRTVAATRHPEISRKACIECHAPIAEEWRSSLHRRSITGPFWQDVRDMGYLRLFTTLRKPCEGCHAPANVLDLASSGAPDFARAGAGIECTPNLLREPAGVTPARRRDDVALGIDCVSCHVSVRGITGPGRSAAAPHEVNADKRFRDGALTAAAVCGTCHGAIVSAWSQASFARRNFTCLDCHMPRVTAPTVTGGPPRERRSHRFLGDKDGATLAGAINASLVVTPDRVARLRIVNDRVGHQLPSGANFLVVLLRARDQSGRVVAETKRAFGRDEPLLFDFWPFNIDRRIPADDREEVALPLPAGRGRVEALVRYHDWIHVQRVIATFEQGF